MTASILFIVTLFFAIRGFFQGFTAVIARLLGFLLGYYLAYSYRQPLAELISEHSSISASPMILQVAASASIFFATVFIIGLLVTGALALVTRLVPATKELFDKNSPGSRVFGAGTNGLTGAAIVLIGLWGYALTVTPSKPPDSLQQFANHFGDSVLALVSHMANDNPGKQALEGRQNDNFDRHSASSENNNSNRHGNGIQQLLQNKKIRNLLDDPAIKKMAIEQLTNKPQSFFEDLNEPQLIYPNSGDSNLQQADQ